MASMVQSYDPNGTSRSVTTGPGVPADDGLMDLFRQQARRNMMAPPPVLRAAASDLSGGRGRNDPAPGVQTKVEQDPNAGLKQYAQQEQLMAQAAAAKAMHTRAPQRMTTFASGTNALVDDPQAMTGAQRAAYLPNNAGFGPSGPPSAAGLTPDYANPGGTLTPQQASGQSERGGGRFAQQQMDLALARSNAEIEARQRALSGMSGQYGSGR